MATEWSKNPPTKRGTYFVGVYESYSGKWVSWIQTVGTIYGKLHTETWVNSEEQEWVELSATKELEWLWWPIPIEFPPAPPKE